MRIHHLLPLLAAATLATGCHKDARKREAPLGAVLPYIPLPPDAQPLTREASANATQILLVTPVSPDSVLAYYRRVLSEDPFHLVNERKSGTSVQLYAEQAGPSIWVTIEPNGKEGSQVTLAGASDSLKPAKGKTTP